MKKNVLERDSKGRFIIPGLWEIQARIAADNEQAQKIVKVCDALGFKPGDLGAKQMESGNWCVDFREILRLSGLALGLALALKKTPEELRELLFLVADALGYVAKPNAAEPETAAVGASV